MLHTIADLKQLLASRKQSFFMKKGIPYDIIDEYEDEGKFFVVGVSDDGEEATEEIIMPFSQGKEDRIAH
jgi:hypothetical protein